MVNEDEAMSPKLRQLVLAGLIKEKKDLPYFKSAMKKVKGGAMTTVQERQVLISVLTQFLDMIDEAPEFFNLMRRELAKPKKEGVDHHERDANGEPIPHDDEEGLNEKTDHDKDGDVDSDDWKIARDKAIKKRMQMKKEDYANAKIKKDEGHKGDKKGADKMQHLKKLKEDPEVEKAHEQALIENALRDKSDKDYGFTGFKSFTNRNMK